MEKVTMKVPTMGDSITEGTIVEWVVGIGQAVKVDDVVALIETDKVTVDIKAEVGGVVVAQYGKVDDNVEVGADLYQIDTEATPSVSSTERTTENSTVAAEVEEDREEPLVTADTTTGDKRTPSIRFLGKKGWEERKCARAPPVSAPTATSSSSSSSSVVTITMAEDPMYGRPHFTDEEEEALISGGANLAPKLRRHSHGAEFG